MLFLRMSTPIGSCLFGNVPWNPWRNPRIVRHSYRNWCVITILPCYSIVNKSTCA